MKVAIPASGNTLASFADQRFGRCPFFCFYDAEKKSIEFKENKLRNGVGGVGLQVSEFLANQGIKKVYAVEFGPKAKDILSKLTIETQIIQNGKMIREIIEMFNN
jgi:predicted Fe-Mo cluster-binding NifX family protein